MEQNNNSQKPNKTTTKKHHTQKTEDKARQSMIYSRGRQPMAHRPH